MFGSIGGTKFEQVQTTESSDDIIEDEDDDFKPVESEIALTEFS